MKHLCVMKQRTLKFTAMLMAVSLAVVWGDSPPASAQRDAQAVESTANEHDDWYYAPKATPEPERSIAHQRAELRAQQRMDRLASQRWYGFTPGRPTANGMPFTGMYSPAWTRPGGRPFAWYTGNEPTVVVAPRYGYRYW